MGQTVYVDLFFLINFSMDFLCLFLTAKILNHRMIVWRTLAAAVVGGVYADLSLFVSFGRIPTFVVDMLVCVLMCGIVFWRPKKLGSLPLYILVFAAVSMALGGFMTALFHLFNRVPWLSDPGISAEEGISVWIFALLAIISGGITLLGGRFFTGRATRKNAELYLYYEGRSLRLRAMTDSGNLLREPISGRLCVVADIRALSPLLPREILQAAKRGDPSALEAVGPRHAKNLRLIPTHTASGEGMLLGVRMERILIEDGKKSREVDAMVALADLGGRAEGSEALLPAGLLVS